MRRMGFSLWESEMQKAWEDDNPQAEARRRSPRFYGTSN
jgi:hypothetical protein